MSETHHIELTAEQISTIKECLSFSQDKIRNFDYTYGHWTEERYRWGEELRKEKLAQLQDAQDALHALIVRKQRHQR